MIQPKYPKFFGGFETLENKGFQLGGENIGIFYKKFEILMI